MIAVVISTGSSSAFDEIIDFMVCKVLFLFGGKQCCKIPLHDKHSSNPGSGMWLHSKGHRLKNVLSNMFVNIFVVFEINFMDSSKSTRLSWNYVIPQAEHQIVISEDQTITSVNILQLVQQINVLFSKQMQYNWLENKSQFSTSVEKQKGKTHQQKCMII